MDFYFFISHNLETHIIVRKSQFGIICDLYEMYACGHFDFIIITKLELKMLFASKTEYLTVSFKQHGHMLLSGQHHRRDGVYRKIFHLNNKSEKPTEISFKRLLVYTCFDVTIFRHLRAVEQKALK